MSLSVSSFENVYRRTWVRLRVGWGGGEGVGGVAVIGVIGWETAPPLGAFRRGLEGKLAL